MDNQSRNLKDLQNQLILHLLDLKLCLKVYMLIDNLNKTQQ